MDKRILKIVGIVLVVLLLGILILLITKQKEKPFKKITINSTNIVINTTNETYLDTIVLVGLNEIGITGITVNIAPMNDQIRKRLTDMDYQALVAGENGFYTLFVVELDRNRYITVISHELTHLKQYQTKRLIINNNVPFWEGKEFEVRGVEYSDRPWEYEAFSNQPELGNKIRKILY